MASGYNQVINRLSGATSFGPPLVPDELDVLQINLQAFLLGKCPDADVRLLAFDNFAKPALLVSLHGHLSTDFARTRFNEYLFTEFDRLEPNISVRERAVVSALAGIIDFGSVADNELSGSYLQAFLYDIFPSLEEFLTLEAPNGPFKTATSDLANLGNYLDSISVSKPLVFAIYHTRVDSFP